jgi:hypothetical protein
MEGKASPSVLRRQPENADNVLKFVFSAEQAASRECGEGTLEDTALLLIAQEHEGAVQ